MLKILSIAILGTVLLSACATQTQTSPATLPDGLHASTVFARSAVKGSGPIGITNRVTLDGKLLAYTAFTWTDPKVQWGTQMLEHRWYKGDHLISSKEMEMTFTGAPFYVWSPIYPVVLGAGKARYELYWHGIKLSERELEVVDAATLAPPILSLPRPVNPVN